MGRHLPETKARLQAEYRERNRAVIRQKGRETRQLLKDEALTRYGATCARCGYDNPLALCIDHINNDGAAERRALGGQSFSGWRFYHYLKRMGWPSGYQTLCANCNLIKHLETLAR